MEISLRTESKTSVEEKVSVIIPAYNMELYIGDSVQSVIDQTYKNLEIIVIDDGSTDGTAEICEELGRNDGRIRVVHKENGGLSDARNYGLQISTGEYIAFLDADDGYYPRFIEFLYDALERTDSDIAMCDFIVTKDVHGNLIEKLRYEEECMTGRKASGRTTGSDGVALEYIVAWNKLYKKQLFDGIAYPSRQNNEDEFITWKLLWKAKQVVYIHTFLHKYLQRETSIMGKRFSRDRLGVIEAHKEKRTFFEKKGLYKEAHCASLAIDGLIDMAIEKLSEQGENVDDLYQLRLKNRAETRKLRDKSALSIKFPCHRIAEGEQIAIYGAGWLGKSFYTQLKESGYARNIIWVDRYSIRDFKEVESIDKLCDPKIDHIVIALLDGFRAIQVKEMLLSMGIKEDKIVWERYEEEGKAE